MRFAEIERHIVAVTRSTVNGIPVVNFPAVPHIFVQLIDLKIASEKELLATQPKFTSGNVGHTTKYSFPR